MINKKIQIRITKNYGNLAYYPECRDSKILAAIAGTKTLTPATIIKAYELGYEALFFGESLPENMVKTLGDIIKAKNNLCDWENEHYYQANFNNDGSPRF